jgi:Ig-like domain CHU_C associated/Secretion system C-terminal sorting domain
LMKLCASNAATVSATTPGFICGAGTATLAATSTGTLRWYNASANGLNVGTGSTYITPPLSSTTTYSVAAYDVNGCSSARTAVVATLTALPTISSSVDAQRCGPGSVNLSATPSAGTVNWYSVQTGGSSLGSGTTFNTPSLSASASFFAEAVNNGCVSALRTQVLVGINEISPVPTAVVGSRCGAGTVLLSATQVPNTLVASYKWFDAPSAGTLLQSAPQAPFTTPSISTNTTYYVTVISPAGCESSPRLAVVATVNTVPTVTSAAGNNRCGSGSVTFNATASAGTVDWYAAPTGGTLLGSGTSFASPSVSTTTTFYAEANNGCISAARTAVVATIKPIPTITSNNTSRCGPGMVALTASSDGAMSWFVSASGGSALATSGNFTTPSLTATTPYFIEASLNGCTTLTRTSVSAVVNPIPALPIITADNSNSAAPVLTSSSSTGNQWFRNDVSVSGATSNSFTITQEGTYKVQVTLLGCLSAMSVGQAFVITGAEDFEINQIQLYPNPAGEELVLNLSGFEVKKPVTISIVDLVGRQMKGTTGVGGEEVRVDIREFTSGQYVAVMQQGANRVAKLFVKKF